MTNGGKTKLSSISNLTAGYVNGTTGKVDLVNLNSAAFNAIASLSTNHTVSYAVSYTGYSNIYRTRYSCMTFEPNFYDRAVKYPDQGYYYYRADDGSTWWSPMNGYGKYYYYNYAQYLSCYGDFGYGPESYGGNCSDPYVETTCNCWKKVEYWGSLWAGCAYTNQLRDMYPELRGPYIDVSQMWVQNTSEYTGTTYSCMLSNVKFFNSSDTLKGENVLGGYAYNSTYTVTASTSGGPIRKVSTSLNCTNGSTFSGSVRLTEALFW
jgi:hypothetical protein